MYWRAGRASGYMLLLMTYIVYTIGLYIYDKLRAAYYFILGFFIENSDLIFWLIIAIVVACFWHLCGWLGRKEKNRRNTTRIDTVAEPEAKPVPISYQEAVGYAPKIDPSSKEVVEEVSGCDFYALESDAIPLMESESLSEPKCDISDKNPVLLIYDQLQEEGLDAPQSQIEGRFNLLTEILHLPEDEARRKTLNYFRRYGPTKVKYEVQKTDFYRSPSWIALAKKIRERDNFTCQQCGRYGPNGGGELHVHHIIPRGRGGSNDPSNLVTLCSDCHSMQPHHSRLRGS